MHLPLTSPQEPPEGPLLDVEAEDVDWLGAGAADDWTGAAGTTGATGATGAAASTLG